MLIYFIGFRIISNVYSLKQIILNNLFFGLYSIKDSKKLYLFYLIMFKKQNSLLKKRFNYLRNLHPVFYRKRFKKRVFSSTKIKNNKKRITVLKNFYSINFLNSKVKTHKMPNILKGKKKFKKTLLLNKKLYKFLTFNIFKTLRRLKKHVRIKSKLKILQNLLSFEYSMPYIILSSNIVKSFSDLKILLRTKYVYLNRMKQSKNFNKVLVAGDYIEFFLVNRIFNYVTYFKKILLKHVIKVRNRLWYKLRGKDRGKFDFNKNTLLNSLFKDNVLFKRAIPNYLEVDYITLSIVIVLKNLEFNSFNLNIKKILVLYLFKLYNWN
jgi:hypothetical protein